LRSLTKNINKTNHHQGSHSDWQHWQLRIAKWVPQPMKELHHGDQKEKAAKERAIVLQDKMHFTKCVDAFCLIRVLFTVNKAFNFQPSAYASCILRQLSFSLLTPSDAGLYIPAHWCKINILTILTGKQIIFSL